MLLKFGIKSTQKISIFSKKSQFRKKTIIYLKLIYQLDPITLKTHLTHNLKSAFSTYPKASIKETHFAKSLGYLLQCVSLYIALGYVKNHLFKLCVR